MKRYLFALFILFSANANANMPYMGPPSGQVSGFSASNGVRIVHEILTVDLRRFPFGNAIVYANYRVKCEKTGTIRFLFIASAASDLKPEIILDGKIISILPDSSSLEYLNYANSPQKTDSFSQIIGYDLRSSRYHNQSILNKLFIFEVLLTEGMHQLKVGYESLPTGFEKGNLRYTTFPYFLGNGLTRKNYDSIFVKVLLPADVAFESNFDLGGTGTELISKNIADFKESHIYISIFKNVENELAKGWTIFTITQIAFCIIIGFLSLVLLRKYRDRTKKIWLSFILVLPVSLLISLVYYFSLLFYYQRYDNLYGLYLKGSWGHGYLFLYIPLIIFICSIFWVILALIYHFAIYGKKWDFTKWIFK